MNIGPNEVEAGFRMSPPGVVERFRTADAAPQKDITETRRVEFALAAVLLAWGAVCLNFANPPVCLVQLVV